MLIGTLISGRIFDSYQNVNGTHNWKVIWLIPAGIAGAVLLFFIIFFRDKTSMEQKPGLVAEASGLGLESEI
jgi:phosphotransferase system  glucose/maltose/N-acetylglucosamine-specific IIC component